jgi:hypothetical protein
LGINCFSREEAQLKELACQISSKKKKKKAARKFQIANEATKGSEIKRYHQSPLEIKSL